MGAFLFFANRRQRKALDVANRAVVSGCAVFTLIHDLVPDGELHPTCHHTRCDLQIHGVVGDGGNGALQARGGVYPIADRQGRVQFDGGVESLALPPVRKEEECAHHEDERQEDDDRFHGGFRGSFRWVQARASTVSVK
ncbi:Uncharacterised protein [Mycobacteroides abscessus subsp. abscessus]|nr:Uncharacterised protein [Mycobacteroides abscessus subsp. abscessus]